MRSKESDIILLSMRYRTSWDVSGWKDIYTRVYLPPVIACILTFWALTFTASVSAATFSGDQAGRQRRDDNIRQEVNNHTAEIAVLRQRAERLEQIIEELRAQLDKAHERGSPALQDNVTKLEAITDHLANDVRQIKNHSNETAAALSEYRQNLVDMEKLTAGQGENMRNLEAAVRSMMDLLQPAKGTATKGASKVTEDIASVEGGRSYKVKAGDTLEKIARQNNTSVQELIQRNQLKKGHLIIVGQELNIP